MSNELEFIGYATYKDYIINIYCIVPASISINEIQQNVDELNVLVMKQTPRYLTDNIINSFNGIAKIDIIDSQNNIILSTTLYT